MSENEKILFFCYNEINLHIFQQAICRTKKEWKEGLMSKRSERGRKDQNKKTRKMKEENKGEYTIMGQNSEDVKQKDKRKINTQ